MNFDWSKACLPRWQSIFFSFVKTIRELSLLYVWLLIHLYNLHITDFQSYIEKYNHLPKYFLLQWYFIKCICAIVFFRIVFREQFRFLSALNIFNTPRKFRKFINLYLLKFDSIIKLRINRFYLKVLRRPKV